MISAIDLDNIHKIPLAARQGLDQLVVDQLRHTGEGLRRRPVGHGTRWSMPPGTPIDRVTIAVVGKYVDHKDAYKSVGEALLKHGGIRQRTRVNLAWLEAEDVEREGAEALLGAVDGILVPGGFGDRGLEGKVMTARYARRPGCRTSASATACRRRWSTSPRNVAGLAGANSTENDRASAHPVIGLITEWRTQSGEVERRSEDSDLGGTMRLGLQEQRLKPGTLSHRLYGRDVVGERHRHRYEFNNRYSPSSRTPAW